MVPEIALTPSVTALFRGAFGDRVAIQHSALSDGERHDQWHRIRRGDVDLVIGTRSAVFAPLDRLGLIVVDEEHDTSYKQEETPRYHGRDVAIVRAHARRRAGRARIGDAVDGDATRTRVSGKYAHGDAGAARPRSAAGRGAHRQYARRVRGAGAGRRSSAATLPPPSPIGSRGASRSSCCSIAAATRRRCSAGSAATRSSAPTAPSR